jgi:thiamine kinase-like enzyme
MHEAACAFDGRSHTWNDALSDPAGGTIVCHNDLEPSNVVFRDGIAVAFIDFEFAAPGRPVYDVAQMARVCVPLDDEVDRARLGYSSGDLPTRLRVVADAYGLDQAGRTDLLATIDVAFARIEAAVRRSVDAGDASAKALWDRTGRGERFERRQRWWAAHHSEFAAALR